MIRQLRIPILAAALIGGSLAVPAPRADAQVSIQLRLGGRDRPLRGRQFETMRALSYYVDVVAWQAANEANTITTVSYRSQQLVTAVNDFSDRASSFHDRMESYQTRPWDLPREVQNLDVVAQRVNTLARRTRAFFRVSNEWNRVMDGLNRMKIVLSGRDVEVPAAPGRWGTYERDYGPFASGGYRPAPAPGGFRQEAGSYQPQPVGLSGQRLDEFRRVSRDLEQIAVQAERVSERSARNYGRAGDTTRNDIQDFREQASELRARSERTGSLDAQEINQLVKQLQSHIQGSERRMRDVNVYPELWDDWGRARGMLERMEQLSSF